MLFSESGESAKLLPFFIQTLSVLWSTDGIQLDGALKSKVHAQLTKTQKIQKQGQPLMLVS